MKKLVSLYLGKGKKKINAKRFSRAIKNNRPSSESLGVRLGMSRYWPIRVLI